MRLLELMLQEFPFSADELNKLVRTAPHRYKVYSIPKRSGAGSRVIAQPAAEVKLLQRWLVEKVLAKFPLHDAAVAYRRNTGIKNNASMHSHQRFLLKLDFHDFFPSITASDFAEHTRKYAPQFASDLQLLSNVLFWKRKGESELRLSIGAPSSPAVSNSIVYDFDIAVAKHAADSGVVYTRYADDMIFSTNRHGVLRDVHAFVIESCRHVSYPKLRINFDKTIFASKKGNRTVTGLVLANDGTVSIGRERKRHLRVMLHHYAFGHLDSEQEDWLRGYLAFVRDVEPDLFSKLRARMSPDTRCKLCGEC